MELPKRNKPETENKKEDGLDKWNDRIDENLEPENENDVSADSKAKLFSEKYASRSQTEDNVD